jgi:hypothetical protein
MRLPLDDQRNIVLDRPDSVRGIHVGVSGPGSSGMQNDLTRSKSNKGPVDGQFSHEFLHRPVWRG